MAQTRIHQQGQLQRPGQKPENASFVVDVVNPRVQSFFKQADETVTSSVTLQDDNDLTGMILKANNIYRVEGILYYNQNVGDFKWTFVFDSALQDGVVAFFAQDTFANALTYDSGVWTTTFNKLDAFDTDNVVVNFFGVMKAHATSDGTFKLQWAQNTSSANATTLKTGTHITITQLN
jgi:hypothetical protein